jgi:hypothetical protein
MYRNDEKRADADKWEGWADLFQFGTLGLLFVLIFILESLPKETARVVVWYGAGFLFITATVGFVLSRVALKKRVFYLNAEKDRVGGLFDKAIEAARKH